MTYSYLLPNQSNTFPTTWFVSYKICSMQVFCMRTDVERLKDSLNCQKNNWPRNQRRRRSKKNNTNWNWDKMKLELYEKIEQNKNRNEWKRRRKKCKISYIRGMHTWRWMGDAQNQQFFNMKIWDFIPVLWANVFIVFYTRWVEFHFNLSLTLYLHFPLPLPPITVILIPLPF